MKIERSTDGSQCYCKLNSSILRMAYHLSGELSTSREGYLLTACQWLLEQRYTWTRLSTLSTLSCHLDYAALDCEYLIDNPIPVAESLNAFGTKIYNTPKAYPTGSDLTRPKPDIYLGYKITNSRQEQPYG